MSSTIQFQIEDQHSNGRAVCAGVGPSESREPNSSRPTPPIQMSNVFHRYRENHLCAGHVAYRRRSKRLSQTRIRTVDATPSQSSTASTQMLDIDGDCITPIHTVRVCHQCAGWGSFSVGQSSESTIAVLPPADQEPPYPLKARMPFFSRCGFTLLTLSPMARIRKSAQCRLRMTSACPFMESKDRQSTARTHLSYPQSMTKPKSITDTAEDDDRASNNRTKTNACSAYDHPLQHQSTKNTKTSRSPADAQSQSIDATQTQKAIGWDFQLRQSNKTTNAVSSAADVMSTVVVLRASENSHIMRPPVLSFQTKRGNLT